MYISKPSTNHHRQIIAVLLVGGKSARMGTNKALLKPADNMPNLLENSITVLQNLSCQKIFISGKINCDNLNISKNIKQIADVESYRGPLVGIISSLEYIKLNIANWQNLAVIFLPVDLPNITSITLNKLMLTLDDTKIDGAIYNRNPLPLVLRFSEKLSNKVEQIILDEGFFRAEKTMSVNRFLETFLIDKIIPNKIEQKHLINTNTPQEWKEATYEHTNR